MASGLPTWQFRYEPYGQYQRKAVTETDPVTQVETTRYLDEVAYESIATGDELALAFDPDTPTTPTDRAWYQFGHQGSYFDQEIMANYKRCRIYHLLVSRFGSVDPNGQALVLSSALRRHAATPMALAGFDAAGIYADGMNFYEYVRSNPPNRTDPTGLFVGYQRFVADVTGSAIAAYAFSLDAGIYSLLEEGPEGTGLDRAIESIPSAVAGAFAGGAVAFANRWSPTGNILGGSVAGGLSTFGLGEGFTSGALIGGGVSAAFEAAFKALGRWRTGAVVGSGAAAGSNGWTTFLRVLRGRGILASARQKAIIPVGTAAKDVAGRWPAAIAPRSGKVYVGRFHVQAIGLAQEGSVMKAGIKSGWVGLDDAGEVIWTRWEKTW